MKKLFFAIIILISQQNFCSNLAYLDAVLISKKLLKEYKLIKVSEYWNIFGLVNSDLSYQYKMNFNKEILEQIYLFRKNRISVHALSKTELDELNKYLMLKNKYELNLVKSLKPKSKL